MTTIDCLIVFGPLIALTVGMAIGLCFIENTEEN